jgi:hypothetical protein
MCNNNQTWAINDNLAYGFAAVSIAGTNETGWCCGCLNLILLLVLFLARRWLFELPTLVVICVKVTLIYKCLVEVLVSLTDVKLNGVLFLMVRELVIVVLALLLNVLNFKMAESGGKMLNDSIFVNMT